MTKRVRNPIAWFLALNVGLAGLIAISPTLHVAVEHAGAGPAHSHQGALAVATTAADRLHGHSHRQVTKQANSREEEIPRVHARRPEFFVSNHGSFSISRFSVLRLWQAFIGFREKTLPGAKDSSGAAPSDNTPDHQHDSLAQLLAGGLIEQSVDPTLLPCVFVCGGFLSPPLQELLLVRRFDAQTAGRAPPPSWS